MDGDITAGTTGARAAPIREDLTAERTDRATPLERVMRSFDAAGHQGWEPPEAPGITVERLLGGGSSALVWLVWWDSPAEPDWHLVDGCPPAAFALKVPRAHLAGRPPLHHVTAELQALDMLRHEHLVRAYGALETSQGIGLMLEPYSAGSLAQLLRGVGRLGLGEVVTVLTPIATALGALHQGGVAHGDVSPGNILLAADGKPALGDLADAPILGTPRSDTGTPGFAAPERELEGRLPSGADSATRRAARAGLAPEADVYSLAAVAWFALTGSMPARDRHRAPLQSLRPELPLSITRLLESGLHDDPALRPDAQDFAVQLFRCAAPRALDLTPHVHEEVVPELPTLTGPGTGVRRWVPRLRAFAVAAVVLAGLWFSSEILTPGPTTPLGPAVQHAEVGQAETGQAEAGQAEAGQAETEEGSDPGGAQVSQEPPASDADRSGAPSTGAASPRPPSPGEQLRDRDPVRAVQGLAALRTQALRETSQEAVGRYTVPESPAQVADAALIQRLIDGGTSYQGETLKIRVTDPGQDVPSPTESVPGRTPPWEPGAGSPTTAELHASVIAGGLDTGVAESQDVVLVMHRQEGQWLLYRVREPGTAVEQGALVPGADAEQGPSE
ncbi:protein kinase [Nesterenkonia sp. E16_7]|uniref:protein kinase domain-containing protein n=1 Tax=unclassified Nesterenkonia TaxID=2629769 RepID=UPI001A93187A|nr:MULTISPECIES: protein kinase [unclassified Nesterenkonia]MBO0595972.1 protein kinase [Nesterenkonia sp. E16_10]MBO0599428.1 protein kinase [Nesterenkonia sp. E16_7]